MKKEILFAFLALALPATAASIDWTMSTGIATKNYMVDEKGNKLTGVAYLMLVSDLESPSFTAFTSEQDIKDLALGGSDGSLAITDGVNKTTKTTTDSRLSAPTSYTFKVLVYDTVNQSYYLSEAKTQSAYNLTGDEYTDPKSISLSSDNMFASSATRGTQTYVPVVPEPSVAFMGLLGLGMLLKRRKA